MMEVEYRCLFEDFLSVAQFHITENILHTLKEHYAQCINSNRKRSQIKDLRTLLKVLEKRDSLSCCNIEPLLYISNNYLNDLHIRSKIQEYKNSLSDMQYSSYYNMYSKPNVNKNEGKTELSNVIKSSTSKVETSNIVNNQSTLEKPTTYSKQTLGEETIQPLQQIILSRVSEKIGRSWRDTIRYLGVPEYQIDIIQSKYTFDLKEQSYEALKLYMTQYSGSSWKIDLIRALEKARRRDLKELVECLILELDKQL